MRRIGKKEGEQNPTMYEPAALSANYNPLASNRKVNISMRENFSTHM